MIKRVTLYKKQNNTNFYIVNEKPKYYVYKYVNNTLKHELCFNSYKKAEKYIILS